MGNAGLVSFSSADNPDVQKGIMVLGGLNLGLLIFNLMYSIIAQAKFRIYVNRVHRFCHQTARGEYTDRVKR